MAGGTIDSDEITAPEIHDPCQVQWQHSGFRSRIVLRMLAGLFNDDQASLTLASAAGSRQRARLVFEVAIAVSG